MTDNPTQPRLYGRRKGRPLRNRKAKLMEELLPELNFALPESGGLDLAMLFPWQPKALWLEVGFGGGEHLAAQAKAHPELCFIGCEPFINGIAGLLDHIERDGIKNVRIFPGDARLLLDALPAESVARCFVLFPDPWPKARHVERRFISVESCARLARAMKHDAELRLASDDPGMIGWFREVVGQSPLFSRVTDSDKPPEDWVATRYEQKALKAGRQPAHMIFHRV